MATRRGDVNDRRAVDNALTLEQWRLVAGNNVICPQRPIQRTYSDSNGFILEWGGVGQFCLGESQSRLYAHMGAKCWRSPTAVSKKVPFNFLSRYDKVR